MVDRYTPEIAAEFARLHERMRKVVDGLDDDALSRSPAEGENSIAVLVTHTLGAELAWLHRAAGRPFERDRDAEFRTKGSAEDLRASIDRNSALVPGLVEASSAAGLGTTRAYGNGETATVGFCVIHALTHAAEHVGHAELTRNLIGHRRA